MAKIKLITVGELRDAVNEAEKMGIKPGSISVTFLDDRVDVSHPEDPGKTVYGLALGVVIQSMRHYGCNVRLQKDTSQRPYP